MKLKRCAELHIPHYNPQTLLSFLRSSKKQGSEWSDGFTPRLVGSINSSLSECDKINIDHN